MGNGALAARIRTLRSNQAVVHESLRFVPITGISAEEPEYRLFGCTGDASLRGDATTQSPATEAVLEISEISVAGSVPKLLVSNKTACRVLLLDGQELVGAKQNRILNLDVLVPAGATLEIPVTCVEAGRWAAMSRFMKAGKSAYRSSRESKLASISRSLKTGSGYSSDQAESWYYDRSLLRAFKVSSASSRQSDAYESQGKLLADIRGKLLMPKGTVGVAVYDGEALLGLDVFDKSSTFQGAWENLADSYLLDYIAFGSRGPKTETTKDGVHLSFEELTEELIAAEWQEHTPPGEGKDLRSETNRLVASALAWQDQQIIHLQAFPRLERQSVHNERPADASIPRNAVTRQRSSSVRQVQGTRAGYACPRCGFTYGLVVAEGSTHCNHCGYEK